MYAARGAGRSMRRGPYEVTRIARPGAALLPDEQAIIVSTICETSNTMFGADMDPYWSARPEYLQEVSELWLAAEQGACVGWCGIAVWRDAPDLIVYIDSLGVLPEHRRTGLGALLILEILLRVVSRERALPWVTLRTESPVIFAMTRRLAGVHDFYPKLDGRVSRTPGGVQRVAAYTAARKSPGKEMRSDLVIPGALDFVQSSLYGEQVPPCGDTRVDEFFQIKMETARGDSVICVGVPNMRSLTRITCGYALTRRRLRGAGLAATEPHRIAVGEESMAVERRGAVPS
jgi:GNAT superfamily N-acetyltransferase